MLTYTASIALPVPVDTAFEWHESSEALPVLLPAFPPARVIEHEGIRNGARAIIELFTGLGWTRWEALHIDYVPGRQFCDIQVSGPFKVWVHTHRFEPIGESACLATDIVRCELHGGRVLNLLLQPLLIAGLSLMFFQRHRALEKALMNRLAQKACAA